jgi:uncharacterized protein (TIGR02300 family)
MPLPNARPHRFAFDRLRRLWQWRARHRGDKALHARHPKLRKGAIVAKPEWGTKRICPSCGTRYYDLMRDPVVCPKCSTPFDPEAFLRARRARPAAPVEKELEPVSAEEVDPDLESEEVETVEDEEEEEGAVPLEEAEEEEEELIEDASELGEDEDDMAEVIDNVEEEEG